MYFEALSCIDLSLTSFVTFSEHQIPTQLEQIDHYDLPKQEEDENQEQEELKDEIT
jgi:hypothetical protein